MVSYSFAFLEAEPPVRVFSVLPAFAGVTTLVIEMLLVDVVS
jgi:hypothetical protein